MTVLVDEISQQPCNSLADRIGKVDWTRMETDLARNGSAVAECLLTRDECEALTSLYPQSGLFRSRIVMGRYAFGKGEYQYFSYPLPDMVTIQHPPIIYASNAAGLLGNNGDMIDHSWSVSS